jgi:adenylate kinase
VFIGIQGSGKGVQADLLGERFGFKHFDLGALLREYVKRDTPFGRKVDSYIKNGNLVPDDEIIDFIKENINEECRGLILDGFPRTIRQAEFIENAIHINYAVYFALDDDTATKRLSSRRICSQCRTGYNLLVKPPKVPNVCDVCGGKIEVRHDDHEAAITLRIERFHELTEPIIELFKNQGKLITVDASPSPEEVHLALIEKLNLNP